MPGQTLKEAGFLRVKSCRHGDLLFNVRDRHIGRSLDLYGEWAESELELLGLLIRAGDTVVDVGANLGTHTTFFAQRVGPSGRVIAFEPQRVVFQMLCANLALNGLTNVHAHPAAAGRVAGMIDVPEVAYAEPGNHGGVSLAAPSTGAPGATGASVPLLALDDLGLDRCRVLKIDVEGMELEVLEGGRALVAAARPIVYVENNDTSRSPALIDWLLARGYHLFWHLSRFFHAGNFFGNPDNVFGDLADLNMIGVGDDLAPAFARLPRVTGRDDHWQALQHRLHQGRPA
jgi:FkbM family methyltransferase